MRRLLQIFAVILSVSWVFSQQATAATYNYDAYFNQANEPVKTYTSYRMDIDFNTLVFGQTYEYNFRIFNSGYPDVHYTTGHFASFWKCICSTAMKASVQTNLNNNYGWTTIEQGHYADFFIRFTPGLDYLGRTPSLRFGIGSVPLPAPISLMVSALAGLCFVSRRKMRHSA